jgi:hypothetical protein
VKIAEKETTKTGSQKLRSQNIAPRKWKCKPDNTQQVHGFTAAPFCRQKTSQVTRGKFINRSVHPTLKEKEGARLLDMIPVITAFKLFSKTEKGF